MRMFIVIALLILMSCGSVKPVKSDVRQRKFVNVWVLAGGIVILWAVQDGVENKEKK